MSKRAVDALLARVTAIPEGDVAATARRAGIPHRHLTRLRQGISPDVRLSTLEKLSQGLGEPISALIGEKEWKPPPEKPSVDPRVVRRLLTRLAAVADAARKVAEELPPED
jgi:transcriptional regulator with XRE-family HTH domain